MARVIVKQVKEENFREMITVDDNDKLKSKALEFLNDYSYESVAELELGGSLSHILSQAYQLTKNICKEWTENPDILVMECAVNGRRSSTTGDIIVLAGEYYLINNNFAFEHFEL